VLQYFISTHGARKGLADTALKTADSGYLTRRLVDVAQDVIISENDCGTTKASWSSRLSNRAKSSSRCATVCRPCALEEPARLREKLIVAVNQEITEELAAAIQGGRYRARENPFRADLRIEARRLRRLFMDAIWPLDAWSNAAKRVGVIAAQSIGEPGTQLTMRTFHIGGNGYPNFRQSKQDRSRTGSPNTSTSTWVPTKRARSFP